MTRNPEALVKKVFCMRDCDNFSNTYGPYSTKGQSKQFHNIPAVRVSSGCVTKSEEPVVNERQQQTPLATAKKPKKTAKIHFNIY